MGRWVGPLLHNLDLGMLYVNNYARIDLVFVFVLFLSAEDLLGLFY